LQRKLTRGWPSWSSISLDSYRANKPDSREPRKDSGTAPGVNRTRAVSEHKSRRIRTLSLSNRNSIKPIRPGGQDDFDRNREGNGGGHGLFNPWGVFGDGGIWHLEDEFVVNLEQQPGRALSVAQVAVDFDHRFFYEVGGGTLDDGVDGEALSGGAHGRVARIDVVDAAAAAEDSLDIAVLAGVGDAMVEERADARVAGEVAIDELLGLATTHACLAGQAEGGLAVDDAEVDGLRAGPLLLRYVSRRHGEELAGDEVVDVLVFGKSVPERLIPAEMGEDAQLDLRVISLEQDAVLVAGDECPADLRAGRGADWNVLDVWIAA